MVLHFFTAIAAGTCGLGEKWMKGYDKRGIFLFHFQPQYLSDGVVLSDVSTTIV